MNKVKLRSLMFHAGFCNEDGGWDNRPLFEQENDNFQKFAELIVGECMALCKSMDETDTRYRYDYRRGVLDCADTIKEHFGVEE